MLGKAKFQTNGTFWLADDPHATCDGSLSIEGRRPSLEVVGELTSAMEPLAGGDSDSSVMVPAKDDETNLLVHGSISQRPGRVTLMNATTRSRQMLVGGKSTHVLDSAHCIIGGHIPSVTHKFGSARVRVSNLEHWAVLPGLSTTITPESKALTIQYELPEPVIYELDVPLGSLKLFASYTLPSPSSDGATIKTQTWLEWTPEGGSDLEQFFAEFIRPIQSLMVILFGSECAAEELEIRDLGADRWMQVFGEGIEKATTTKLSPQALLTRDDTGLDLIARWMEAMPRLTPIPQILAGTLTANDQFLEAEVLNLCTATEGFHRRTHLGERRLSVEDVEVSKSLLDSSDFPDDVRQVLRSALAYLWEPSFPQRLAALAERVSVVNPHITGRANKWKQAVTDARNANAHSLDMNKKPSDFWEHSFVIARSLRWLITVVLLLEANVPEQTLRPRLNSCRTFRNFVSMSQELFPKVYPKEPDSAQ